MPSNKDKVFAYLESDLYARVVDFKDTQQYASVSQALIAILEEYFGCSQQKQLAINPDVEDRLKYLENQLTQVIELTSTIAGEQSELNAFSTRLSDQVRAGIDCYTSLEKLVMNRLREVEESTESLNNLCKLSFEIAFNRIGRLERGERVNDLSLDESAANLQNDLAKVQESMVDLAKEFNASEVTVTVSLDEGMTLKQVAEYIGLNDKRLIKTRKEKGDRFLEYLQQKSGKVWEFDPQADRHGKYRIVAESAVD